MESKQVVVVIPVYKEKMSEIDYLSFQQCLNVLRKHEIVILTYQGLSIVNYLKVCADCHKSVKVEYFDCAYFKSVVGYNKLMLSNIFYSRFLEYEYIFIYQLDAFVFRDELEYWCNLGYDYIGAPWLRIDKKGHLSLYGVGNGGFSLRRVQYCVKVLRYPAWLPFLHPLFLIRDCSTVKAALMLLFAVLGYHNCLKTYINGARMVNEDILFGHFTVNSWLTCNIPEPDVAMKFSFERNPSYLFHLNNNKLPFGCHAFEKYEYTSFWEKYIKALNI